MVDAEDGGEEAGLESAEDEADSSPPRMMLRVASRTDVRGISFADVLRCMLARNAGSPSENSSR